MRVMAIGAHPDDIEILAAGTLACYRLDGHAVAICVMTNGELGAESGDRAAVAELRRQEAQRSAEIIGATLYWLGEPDGFLFDTTPTRMALLAAVRDFAPDILLTHDPADYHPDHRTASLIALNVRQLASAELIETAEPVLNSAPPVLYMDPLALTGTAAETWVDISATIETKREMLRCHQSQNAWMRRMHELDYVDYVDKQAALRGLQCGVAFAEGFRDARVFPVTANTTALLPN
ncbi:PIG-L deacetylase family protein [Nocardia sp. NPDC051832]|uniref:PIG-L deacetylase family protein n=1 Tax=Nocardia sp. NPDC051832 TaxID=3155673 RepID=UPI00343CCD1B